jgi:hypothetical protein
MEDGRVRGTAGAGQVCDFGSFFKYARLSAFTHQETRLDGAPGAYESQQQSQA